MAAHPGVGAFRDVSAYPLLHEQARQRNYQHILIKYLLVQSLGTIIDNTTTFATKTQLRHQIDENLLNFGLI